MLKSIFIPAWMLTLCVLMGWSLWTQFQHQSLSLFWSGLLLLAAIGPGMIVSLFVARTARTSRNLLAWNLLALAGFSLGILGWRIELPGQRFPIGLLTMAALGWLAYVFWYSRLQKPRQTPLQLGEPLPLLELQNLQGQTVLSQSWLGQAVLILFFRGNWCPLCMAQIREIAKLYRQLTEQGVRIILISPQSESHSQALAQKFDAPLEFLTDPEGKMAQKLGVFHPWALPAGMQVLGYEKDSVLPTLVITDAQGSVRFVEIADNYRLRPEPQVFLQVLAKLGLARDQRLDEKNEDEEIRFVS
ncbi:MAG: hypothetical protein CVV27_05160 [Candidatus Melainabacteria bacterium HGW-Melainabacteria-1]|nr:MAG: hypothetical protein CVV27_05160 [Candidatus Melainabacteria bacterium HGW-Melainabacteria-1]